MNLYQVISGQPDKPLIPEKVQGNQLDAKVLFDKSGYYTLKVTSVNIQNESTAETVTILVGDPVPEITGGPNPSFLAYGLKESKTIEITGNAFITHSGRIDKVTFEEKSTGKQISAKDFKVEANKVTVTVPGDLAVGKYDIYLKNSIVGLDKVSGFEIRPITTSKPVITVVGPEEGAWVPKGVPIFISAIATDDAKVSAMGLEIDGKKIARPENNFLAKIWDTSNAAVGSHQIRITAINPSGSWSEKYVNVTVLNQSNSKFLMNGSYGDDVAVVQAYLWNGNEQEPYGKFGDNTEKSVRDWQERYNGSHSLPLEVNGKVDQLTWRAMGFLNAQDNIERDMDPYLKYLNFAKKDGYTPYQTMGINSVKYIQAQFEEWEILPDTPNIDKLLALGSSMTEDQYRLLRSVVSSHNYIRAFYYDAKDYTQTLGDCGNDAAITLLSNLVVTKLLKKIDLGEVANKKVLELEKKLTYKIYEIVEPQYMKQFKYVKNATDAKRLIDSSPSLYCIEKAIKGTEDLARENLSEIGLEKAKELAPNLDNLLEKLYFELMLKDYIVNAIKETDRYVGMRIKYPNFTEYV